MSRFLAETVIAIIIENLIIKKACLDDCQQSNFILEKKNKQNILTLFLNMI